MPGAVCLWGWVGSVVIRDPASRGPEETRVVSIRVNASLANRLDSLCVRTGRSRSFYLREALNRMLPYLEGKYWADTVLDRQQREDAQFEQLMRSLSAELDADEAVAERADSPTDKQPGPDTAGTPDGEANGSDGQQPLWP
ncbi:ribbon-helix-helix protein, CopG family [Dermacoccus nishinomiyaensis]